MSVSAAQKVRQKIERGGTRLWRIEDFRPLPARAVARELSRLAAEGKVVRIRKGLYRKGRGKISPEEIIRDFRAPIHAAGPSAAHLLGLAPAPRKPVYATTLRSVPGEMPGRVLLRRPRTRIKLDAEDGALMEFLRDRGRYADASPGEIMRRLRRLAGDRWSELLPAVLQEPPRVRAIWGALGEEWGASQKDLWKLQRTLNPLSHFDGGIFASLPQSRKWNIR